MTKPSILVIGGGFMGGALAQQWRRGGWPVTVVEPNETRRSELAALGLTCHAALTNVPPAPVVVPQPVVEVPEMTMTAQMLTAIYLRNPKPSYPGASRRLGEQGELQSRVLRPSDHAEPWIAQFLEHATIGTRCKADHAFETVGEFHLE